MGISFMGSGQLFAQVTPQEPTVALQRLDEAQEIDLTRRLEVGRVDEPLQLDGRIGSSNWAGISTQRFLDAASGEAPETRTTFHAAYDDRYLYFAFHGHEAGPESIVINTDGRDDRQVFQGDAIELFLNPEGEGASYYHMAFNGLGAHFDQRVTMHGRQRGDMERQPWDSDNTRVAAHLADDDWKIEVAIPFEDLGIVTPEAGTVWRVNFGRTEKPGNDRTAWGPTGGPFHRPDEFGYLVFGDENTDTADGPVTDDHVLKGRLVQSDGEPAGHVLVRSRGVQARADANGYFEIPALSPGEHLLVFDSPRYELVQGRVRVARPVEVLDPVVLQPHDPYRPTYEVASAEQAVTWLPSHMMAPPEMNDADGVSAPLTGLDLQLAPGETHSRAVAFVAHEAIDRPQLEIEWKGSMADQLRKHTQIRWTERSLRRYGLRQPREESIFSWRFLWEEAPERLEPGHLRQLVVTIDLPETMRAGTYDGNVVLRSPDGEAGRVPIQLRVHDFVLEQPSQRVGVYVRHDDRDWDAREIELGDIRAHGGTHVFFTNVSPIPRRRGSEIEIDLTQVRQGVKLQQEHGLQPPYIVQIPFGRINALTELSFEWSTEYAERIQQNDTFREVYRKMLDELGQFQQELGEELAVALVDEIMGHQKYDVWLTMAEMTREFSDFRIYVTLHNRDSENDAKIARAAEYLDIRNYHGRVMQGRWDDNDYSPKAFRQELAAADAEAWTYYNQTTLDVTSEHLRLCNGYWLWQTPFRVHLPYVYSFPGGDPFDDLDHERRDHGYAFHHPEKQVMVSTLEWELYREGYNDLRYLVTLEDALERAKQAAPDHRAVERAGHWLAQLRKDPVVVPDMASELTPEDYHERRRQMATMIEQLHEAIHAMR